MLNRELVDKALGLIKRRADYEYFFAKLEKADWILPLREGGLFSNPPEVERDGTYIRHHDWPESSYLKRMAEKAPDLVCETILKIPETENERVHEDFVEAALKMPVEYAKEIAKKELNWIRSQKHFYFFYPESVGKLITLLAQNGELGIALHLVEAILALDKVEREYGVPGEDWYHKSVDVVGKFRVWEYKRVVEQTIPDISRINGVRTINVLSGLLENGIEMDPMNPNPPRDSSYIWLPAIEEHEQNRHADSDIKAVLTIAIRDASQGALEVDSSQLPKLVSSLESRPWSVFKRVALFLLAQHAEEYSGDVAEKLTDKQLFDDVSYRHEYAQLAEAGFELLVDADKQKILSWIEAEPAEEDIADYKEWYLGKHGKEATEEDVDAIKEQRRLNRIWQFRNGLTADWQERYEDWVRKYNEPEHPDFAYFTSGATWVGPTSPKSSEDLQTMDIPEIVEFLKDWSPEEGPFVDTPEGLGRSIAQAVSSDPVRLAEHAPLFKGLDPTYVRGLIDGLRDVPKNRDDIPWEPLIELFQWVVDQPREIPGRQGEYADLDPGWVWTRKSIAERLSSGLKSCPGEIPFEFRSRVWPLIEALSNDSDPSNEEYSEGEMDPSSRSINSVRGQSMHAAVDYGLWVVRHTEQPENITFDVMPELRTVFDSHLSVDFDPSLAIRSVYGQWFPWLHLMDSAWAEANKGKIFSAQHPNYWDAAWKTYITFCQPFDVMLDVLRDQYALAIGKLGEPSAIDIRIANADQRLEEHLLVFYWRGKLTLDDDLIRSFYGRANVELKSSAMEFLGRSLRSAPKDFPEEIQARLKAFWNWRYEQAIGVDEDAEELADYCWWFSSGILDADWSITQLKAVLHLPIKFDALDFAAEELVRLMPERPSDVLECVRLMIGCLKTEGVYFSWNDEAKKILSAAMQFDDGPEKEQAIDIIHRLGAMGHFEFRELLG